MKNIMIDYNFVPETLEQCKAHYVPPIKQYIFCKDFGKCDGMDGSCHWCREMLPYQWHMCYDESWVRNLISPLCCAKERLREEAAELIEKYKSGTLYT